MAKELTAKDVFDSEYTIAKLVEKLQDIYPPITPGPGDDYALIMYRAGQRQVVEYLTNLIED